MPQHARIPPCFKWLQGPSPLSNRPIIESSPVPRNLQAASLGAYQRGRCRCEEWATWSGRLGPAPRRASGLARKKRQRKKEEERGRKRKKRRELKKTSRKSQGPGPFRPKGFQAKCPCGGSRWVRVGPGPVSRKAARPSRPRVTRAPTGTDTPCNVHGSRLGSLYRIDEVEAFVQQGACLSSRVACRVFPGLS